MKSPLLSVLCVASVLMLPACERTQPNSSSQADTSAYYEDFEKDRVSLRATMNLTSPPLKASSPEAGSAARRLFTKVPFVGMSREQVLKILGDPKTISDYGIAAAETPDSSLCYRFDSGFGGWDYVLHFQDGHVTRLEQQGID